MTVRIRPSLLDVAAEVLVADPAASLAQVAEAAGIGRTTLHKHYATRDDLIHAVGERALDLWEQAVAEISNGSNSNGSDSNGGHPDGGHPDGGHPDGGLRAATEAMIPIGPQLAFLWRTPVFDHDQDIEPRWRAVEAGTLAILVRARDRGEIAATVPDWWLLNMFYSMIYIAAEAIQNGLLAPRDAPGLALRTFLHGLGTPRTPRTPRTPQNPQTPQPSQTPQGKETHQ